MALVIPPTELCLRPKGLWRPGRQVETQSHLRTQNPKRLAEVTYDHVKEVIACANLTGKMQERASVGLFQIIPGRLPGRAT